MSVLAIGNWWVRRGLVNGDASDVRVNGSTSGESPLLAGFSTVQGQDSGLTARRWDYSNRNKVDVLLWLVLVGCFPRDLVA